MGQAWVRTLNNLQRCADPVPEMKCHDGRDEALKHTLAGAMQRRLVFHTPRAHHIACPTRVKMSRSAKACSCARYRYRCTASHLSRHVMGTHHTPTHLELAARRYTHRSEVGGVTAGAVAGCNNSRVHTSHLTPHTSHLTCRTVRLTPLSHLEMSRPGKARRGARYKSFTTVASS